MILLLSMEHCRHRAQQSYLEVSITIKLVRIGNADTEVTVDAHLPHRLQKVLPIAFDCFVESVEVPWSELYIVARHDFRVLQLRHIYGPGLGLGLRLGSKLHQVKIFLDRSLRYFLYRL